MAVTIVATPGASDANSYCTQAEATAYMESRLYSDGWDGASSDEKNRALVMATRLLDDSVVWDGSPADYETQALQWPRSGMIDRLGGAIEDDEIPADLKNATAEFAYQLLSADRSLDSSQGISAVGVGSIKVNFNTATPQKRKVVPDAVRDMIDIWIDEDEDESGCGPVFLTRA